MHASHHAEEAASINNIILHIREVRLQSYHHIIFYLFSVIIFNFIGSVVEFTTKLTLR